MRARLPRCQEQAEDRPREQELQLRGERARAVPAATAVKELLSARAQRRENVLEVRCRSRKRTEGGRIERAAPGGEKSDRPNPAPDLEAAAADVLMRKPVSGKVQERSKQQRARTRTSKCASRSTRRNMQGNDHAL